MNGNFGLIQQVTDAELGRLWSQSKQARHTPADRSQIETRVWLWQHKTLFSAIGALVLAGLLIAGGTSA
ncbi:MAG: hypothetical protein HY870_23180 [Chloroflexi bacterium]|nr:hypothetical protein [Chloroflexota bacterium]